MNEILYSDPRTVRGQYSTAQTDYCCVSTRSQDVLGEGCLLLAPQSIAGFAQIAGSPDSATGMPGGVQLNKQPVVLSSYLYLLKIAHLVTARVYICFYSITTTSTVSCDPI